MLNGMTWDQWRMIAEAADQCGNDEDDQRRAHELARAAKDSARMSLRRYRESMERYDRLIQDYAPEMLVVPRYSEFRSDVKAPLEMESEQHEPCFGEVSQ